MSLQFSEIDFNEESKNGNKGKSENTGTNKRKNKTIKKRTLPHHDIDSIENSGNLGQMFVDDKHFLNNEDNEDNKDDLANFDSNEKMAFPERPQLTQYKQEKEEEDEEIQYDPNITPYSQENFANAAAEDNSSYYEHFVPNYQIASNTQSIKGANGELMQKLNNILHLLEEQKDTKTSNVTEELILYLFLGVFVIFTVDSFTKVGKYTR